MLTSSPFLNQPFYKTVVQTLLFGCANPSFELCNPVLNQPFCKMVVHTLLFGCANPSFELCNPILNQPFCKMVVHTLLFGCANPSFELCNPIFYRPLPLNSRKYPFDNYPFQLVVSLLQLLVVGYLLLSSHNRQPYAHF